MTNLFVRLHHFYDVGIRHLLPLGFNSSVHVLIFIGRLSSLLLCRCYWNYVYSQLRVRKLQVNLNFLGWQKLGLRLLLFQQLDLRFAHIN